MVTVGGTAVDARIARGDAGHVGTAIVGVEHAVAITIGGLLLPRVTDGRVRGAQQQAEVGRTGLAQKADAGPRAHLHQLRDVVMRTGEELERRERAAETVVVRDDGGEVRLGPDGEATLEVRVLEERAELDLGTDVVPGRGRVGADGRLRAVVIGRLERPADARCETGEDDLGLDAGGPITRALVLVADGDPYEATEVERERAAVGLAERAHHDAEARIAHGRAAQRRHAVLRPAPLHEHDGQRERDRRAVEERARDIEVSGKGVLDDGGALVEVVVRLVHAVHERVVRVVEGETRRQVARARVPGVIDGEGLLTGRRRLVALQREAVGVCAALVEGERRERSDDGTAQGTTEHSHLGGLSARVGGCGARNRIRCRYVSGTRPVRPIPRVPE